jgi:hypothetical protein
MSRLAYVFLFLAAPLMAQYSPVKKTPEVIKAEIETNSDEYAPLFAWLMGSVSLPSAEIAKFYSLGNGRKYPLFATEAEAATAKAAAIEAADHKADRDAAIESTATRINAASEAFRSAIDDPDATGNDIIAATVEAFG